LSPSTSCDRAARNQAASNADRAEAGFTLIEVVVALAVVAVSLAAIGSLMATTVRGMRAIDTRLALIETARAIETSLPDRDELKIGNVTGDLADHRWRVDVLPFLTGNIAAQQSNPWVPQTIIIRVQSPNGAIIQIDTVRLRQRTTQ
jgi:general secretion pathway protein I